jgi:hypothetical protein
MRALLLMIFSATSGLLFAQCGGTGIQFSTQNQVSTFLDNNPDCDSFEGYVFITGNVNDLSGFAEFTSVGGYLNIIGADQLTSLAGLEGLTAVGGSMLINENASLGSLAALSNLTSVGGDLNIDLNPVLQDLSGLNSLVSVGNTLNIGGNEIGSLNGLQSLQSVGGDLLIGGNDNLTSLDALTSLETIGGDFSVTMSPALIALMSTPVLTTLNGRLNLAYNDVLTDITGLAGLTSMGELRITNNYALESLAGLEQLVSVDGDVNIDDNPLLQDLLPLSNLVSMNGELEIRGSLVMESLEGLDNLNPSGIEELSVGSSPNLSDCAIASICAYLGDEMGPAYIDGSATGCNSIGEVLAICALSTADMETASLAFYPNPAQDQIQFSELYGPVEVFILSLQGQIVHREYSTTRVVDVHTLPAGAYMIQVKSTTGWHSGRLLKY